MNEDSDFLDDETNNNFDVHTNYLQRSPNLEEVKEAPLICFDN